MKRFTALASLLLIPAAALGGPSHYDIPLNPEVTQATIQDTICQHGYTKTVRPPVSYTNQIKIQLMQQEGLPLELISNKILDHRIALSSGGAPSDPRNLVLQDRDDAARKDQLEFEMHRQICSGQISLHDAQMRLWNWRP